MNHYFIIHGSFGNSFVNWFPYLRKEIEKKELEVYTPDFPTGVCKIWGWKRFCWYYFW